MTMGHTDAERAYSALQEYGSKAEAARALGIPRSTFRGRLSAYYAMADADPSIRAAASAGGIENPANLKYFWKIAKDDEGNGYSLFVKNPAAGEEVSIADMVRDSIHDALADRAPKYGPRPEPAGEYLLVIDLADVHFMKLCVKSETGFEYSREVARHRVVEGTRALLKLSSGFGVGRILFVLGNDILHVDGAAKKTTSGTPQDMEGSVFQGFSDAFSALRDAIELCADVAPVDLIHCMSNHDWVLGWALSQKLAAWFANHPNVRATDYNMSERHRKYYGFGQNAFQIHHADGANEDRLYGLFVTEARDLIGKCQHLYSLCHHFHHKIRKRRGADAFVMEKDHTGITAIMTGAGRSEGSDLVIEYIRSPSPPDGWHDRNGYVNRQAVECFLHHPHDGQKARFTEWF